MSDALTWLHTIFQDGDIYEIRAKGAGDERIGWRGWLEVGADDEKLLNTIIPGNAWNRRNIWAGVCPRVARNLATPSLARVLWADLDGVGPEDAVDSLSGLGIPEPTMAVNSGHGTHLYWKLREPVPANDVRPYTRWLSHNIPGGDGGTYDPTRVLRIPGTTNFKEPAAPCEIVTHEEARVYPISDFPRMDSDIINNQYSAGLAGSMPLAVADRNEFLENWVEGKRHHVALAVAGYLRKSLGYSEEQAVQELQSIHYETGGRAGDENDYDIRNVVRTTYQKPLPLVRGYYGLKDNGIELVDPVTFKPSKPVAKPRINLVNFAGENKKQEFWVDGFVGPGLMTLVVASPKTGKSFFTMQLGHAIANGYPVFDFKSDLTPRRVLYFQGELSQGMVYERAMDMFPTGTFEDASKFGMTGKPDKVLNLVRDPEPLLDLAEHYDVIIVDPISVFSSNDENSVNSVLETLSVFDSLKAAGKAVVLVHHTNKLETDRQGRSVIPSMNNIRGSGQWFAAVDAVGLMYPKGEDGNVEMRFAFRAAPDRQPLLLYRLEHGGFTSDRETYLTKVVKRGIITDLSRVVN